MKSKIVFSLVVGSFLSGLACNPRQVDDGMYTSGQNGMHDDASATDRAETTVTNTDTTAIKLQVDSVAAKQKGQL